MVSLRQLEVLNFSLEGSLSLNQDGTNPHRMGAMIRSDESAPCHGKRLRSSEEIIMKLRKANVAHVLHYIEIPKIQRLLKGKDST